MILFALQNLVESLGTALFERWSGFSEEAILPKDTDPLFELDVSIPEHFDTAALLQRRCISVYYESTACYKALLTRTYIIPFCNSNYSELSLHKQDGSGRRRKLLPLSDSGTVAEGVDARDDDDNRIVRQPGPKNLEELLEKLRERYLETLYIENVFILF